MTATRTDRHVDTVVVGGQIVTSSQVYEASIAIDGEKIAAIGPENLLPPADNYIDASGMFVLPGLIDCHVHLDGHDNYALGSLAAAHAGLTTLVPFGTYNLEGDETLPEAINRCREEVERTAVTDFAFHFILQNRPSILNSLPQALDMGVKSYKMFMTYKKRPYRMCDDDYICQSMEMVAKGGGVLQLHCESGNIIEYLENKLLSEGHTHPTDFPSACPDWAEEEAINRAVKMAAATNCPTYVVHLSTQLGLERIKQAQAMGQRIWTESCPQYLLLSDEEMAKYGPLAKIGPPLRPGRWARPGCPVAGPGAGPHLHHRQRSRSLSPGVEAGGLGQHLRGPERRLCALRVAGGGDPGAADVQRGRGAAGPAHLVAGQGYVGKSRPHLWPLPA